MTPSLQNVVGLPNGPFRCIVADPPWDHSDGTGASYSSRGRRDCALPYPTMTVPEICAMPVANIAARDALLFLWTTNRFLEDACAVCRAWGFNRVATLVWCKQRGLGSGGVFYSNVEFILYGKRGSPATPARLRSRWFDWPRSRHSAKPEAFQDVVEQVTAGPYLELFARRPREGWTTIGNEADGMDVKDSLILLAQGKHPCYGVEKHGESRHEKDV